MTSEIVLGAVVFVVLFELVAREDDLPRRVGAAAPAVLATLGYLAFYASQGYGARASAVYVSPFTEPADYALVALQRVPVLLGDAFGALPAEAWGFGDATHVPLIIYGLIATLVVTSLGWRRRPRRRSHRIELWLVVSAALALVPAVGGFIGGRLVTVASFGVAPMLAIAMIHGLRRGRTRPGRIAARIAVAALVILHLAVAPFIRAAMPTALGGIAERQRQLALDADLSACGDAEHLYVLTGSDPSNSMYYASARIFYGTLSMGRFESVRALSMTPADQRLTWVDENSFVLEVTGERPASLLERVHRDRPLEVGATVTVDELAVEVLRTGPTGWRSARFRIDAGRDDVCFASWDGERMRVRRASELGDVEEMPFHPGPMGM
jgi:hypothetical protein